MSRETEDFTLAREAMRRSIELCNELKLNANEPSPRTLKYIELRKMVKRVEKICRDISHERGDDFTWLELGNYFGTKLDKAVQFYRNNHRWTKFGELAAVFELCLHKFEILANRKTEVSSFSRERPLLLLPQFLRKTPQPGRIILP
jgi:hypothetical protein